MAKFDGNYNLNQIFIAEKDIISNDQKETPLNSNSSIEMFHRKINYRWFAGKKTVTSCVNIRIKNRDANPLQNSGWFGLWVFKIWYFGFGFGFRVFKNPILGLGSGSEFKNFPKKPGFEFRFCKKKHQNTSEIALKNIFLIYWGDLNCYLLKLILKIEIFYKNSNKIFQKF